MLQRYALLCAAGLGLLPAPGADHAPALSKGVKTAAYTGWADSLFVEATDVDAEVVVVPAIGGRIARYAINGENIVYEHIGSAGKTLANTPTNFWVGGYQCDIGPEIRGIPDHASLWMGPHQWRATRDYQVVVTSAPDVAVGIQLEKGILLDPETGELGVTQQMKNVSDQTTVFCLWDRTLCWGGGFAFFPLNRKSRFPAGWSMRRSAGGKYAYDGVSPVTTRVKVLDGVLVAKADGPATKIGADSDAEWIAYARGRLLFIKYFPYFPKGDYTDGGNSVELYFDERVAELEPLSPEIRLRPRESYVFPEKWVLVHLEDFVTTFEQARALVLRVPPSPFGALRK